MTDRPDPAAADKAVGEAEEAAQHAEQSADRAEDAADRAESAAEEVIEVLDVEDFLLEEEIEDVEPGDPLPRHSPFYIGFFGALGAILAIWLGHQILAVGNTLILVVVAFFLAVGLNPVVEFFMRRGLKRAWSVAAVTALVIVALALFLVAIVPVISDQVSQLVANAPDWLDRLEHNHQVQKLDDQYDIITKAKDYLAHGKFASTAFGGVLGIGIAVLSALANIFIITVLTLYFLASLPATKSALYHLAPASRRPRVSSLGDQILSNVGSYVSGAFVVAVAAGVSTLVFLFAIGLGQYAVALAFVVALLDVIPMIGATIGAVIVTAIAFATDPTMGLACLVFYVVYQQLENYVIYPRVMSRSVDIPGAVIVIAALIGAGLLGVVGALLAIPTAAAILLLVREVLMPRQDAR
ncbi:putative PurR-regulated permease PerM [Nocardioides ginsengisegetis]|uniref:Putative PurR-regulated permease PerM n=1 Tax=Nocardioides ginsengisegetis TaxID=661491 RepID=A0A7W3P8R7_9ACTN|nr:putative PurR-regulated permease PerM [Nocardioides ginsengisegetis]